MEAILLILLGISVYININSMLKTEKYEEVLSNKTDEMDSLIVKYSEILSKIQEIDSKGSFESDDEVGTTFALLKSAIEEGKEYLIKYSTDDSGTGNR
jgi:hypothetical protein